MTRAHSILRLAAPAVAALALLLGMRIPPLGSAKCDPDNGGLVLPEGFCATVVASDLGPVRQLVVAPNGDLYAALSGKPGDNTGGVLAFRDKDGDGKPDERASFGPGGGNDVKIHNGYVTKTAGRREGRYRGTQKSPGPGSNQSQRTAKNRTAPPTGKPAPSEQRLAFKVYGNGYK